MYCKFTEHKHIFQPYDDACFAVSEAGAAMVTMLAHMIITKGLAWGLRVSCNVFVDIKKQRTCPALRKETFLKGSYRIQLSTWLRL